MRVEVEDTGAFRDEAIRCIYTYVLRDMRPPWLEHCFPQALSGNGVLSKYTRPCFLTWGADLATTVFGQPVVAELARITGSFDLVFSGVVARPLYACTADVQGSMCMAMASMSRIFQGGTRRGEYLCHECAERSGGTPGSDSLPLRILLLYSLIAGGGGQDFLVRTRPLRVVVRAPPDTWGWGAPEGDQPEHREASPEWSPEWEASHWRYNKVDSDQIWWHAAPFRGTPADGSQWR